MKVSDAILISRLGDMIYTKENMTAEEFFNCDVKDLVHSYGIDEELVDYVMADLYTYYDF